MLILPKPASQSTGAQHSSAHVLACKLSQNMPHEQHVLTWQIHSENEITSQTFRVSNHGHVLTIYVYFVYDIGNH